MSDKDIQASHPRNKCYTCTLRKETCLVCALAHASAAWINLSASGRPAGDQPPADWVWKDRAIRLKSLHARGQFRSVFLKKKYEATLPFLFVRSIRLVFAVNKEACNLLKR
ncbi:MAG: hypothetical protein ACXWJD_13375 [Burkholderiaceae bacterium]